MFQFNFEADEEEDQRSNNVTESVFSNPWQRKILTAEEQAAASCDNYNLLSWDEKWQKCSQLPTSSSDSTVQYVWHFDMINDVPRNSAYNTAIRRVLDDIRATDTTDALQVLDVGTGSGLLALLAAKHGASCVTALEVEAAVARVASINISKNEEEGVVRVQNGHSMSPAIQVPSPVHLIVTELLDTGLLGEAFIPVLRDAKRRGWMRDDCRVIPARGRVFGQLVQSSYMHHLASLDPSSEGFGFSIPLASDVACTEELISPFDCSFRHLVQNGQAVTLSAPFVAWDFDFEDLPAELGRSKVLKVPVSTSGKVDAVLFWWEVGLDSDWNSMLSSEAVDRTGSGNKRKHGKHQDHWVQAFTIMHSPFNCQEEQVLNVHTFHNDENIWFDIPSDGNNSRFSQLQQSPSSTIESKQKKKSLKKNSLITDLFDSERVLQMNSFHRSNTIRHHVDTVLGQTFLPKAKERVYCTVLLGDGPLLPLLVSDCFKKIVNSESDIGANHYKVIHLDGSEECQALSTKYLLANEFFPPSVTSSTCDPDWALKVSSVHLVCGEPFFQPDAYCKTWGKSALIRYWLACHALTPFLAPDAVLLPACAVLRVAAVECTQLWQARLPCPEIVEGLDLTALNSLHSFNKTDSVPLWRYDHRFLSTPVSVLEMNFWMNPGESNIHKLQFEVEINRQGTCHGLVMWIEYSGKSRRREAEPSHNMDDDRKDDGVLDNIWCSSAPSIAGAATPHLHGLRFCPIPISVEIGRRLACKAALDVLGNDITAVIAE